MWLQYGDLFPVRRSLVYLNHAAVSPLCRPASEAMRRFALDAMDYGSFHYSDWLDTYEAVRASTARLINASKNEIALMKNTSEGVCTVAAGIAWREGDAWLAGGTWLFSEQQPRLRRLIDLQSLGCGSAHGERAWASDCSYLPDCPALRFRGAQRLDRQAADRRVL